MLRTALTDLLDLSVPLIQAPMGGGPTTPALVAAVSAAGALGSLAAGYLSTEALADELKAVRALTSKPFAVNVFCATDVPPQPDRIDDAQAALEPLRQELGLPPRAEPTLPSPQTMNEQIDLLAQDPPAVVSFTFGLPDPDTVRRLHTAGCLLAGSATTVEEARAVADAGLDIVCVQGSEAGAHRGTFLGDPQDALIGTIALVPQVCDAVPISVIAAGGIMDGRGLVAALALGAAGAQLGTAFLRCPEAGTAAPYRRALAAAEPETTTLTSKVTGRLARGIRNPLTETLEPVAVPSYPIMHALTAELRRHAAQLDRDDLMSLWAGQGFAMGTDEPARDLIHRISDEAEGVTRRLAQTVTAAEKDR